VLVLVQVDKAGGLSPAFVSVYAREDEAPARRFMAGLSDLG
jgi:hypothetical protein